MTATPMRRWETLVALTAVVLAAGALLPLPPVLRIICAAAAIATLLLICGMRLRAYFMRHEPPPLSDTYAKIDRIRAARGPRRR